MSTVLLGILVVGGSVLLALLVQTLVRRAVSLEVLEAHHTVAGHMMAIVGGMFGILVAFAVVVVWEQYDRAREGASDEANAAADLYRLVRALPPPAGDRLAADVGDYLQILLAEEWPRFDSAGGSEIAQRALDDLWRGLTAFAPADDRTRNLQLAALGSLEALTDHRRLRLLHAEHEMPDVLWAVLVVGAVLTVAYANFFGLRYRGSQAAMVGSLAGIVALVIFTVWVLDHPYRGSTRVHAGDFELVLRLLEADRRQ
jgi:Protein of unknown function (DUF4239)